VTIEEALKTYLQSVAGVSSLVSTRIYPETLPQEPTLPALKYDIISIERQHLIDFATMYIQYTSVATTHLGARALSDAVRKALQREKRVISGIEVTQISVDDEQGVVFDQGYGEYYTQTTYKVNYREE
jgi:hypothetical protein